MRVTPCGDDDISANNVELAMRYRKIPLLSWRGTAQQFFACFRPLIDSNYPKLAGQ